MDKTAKQVKVLNYRRSVGVNVADRWEEGVYAYPGRSVWQWTEGEARPEEATGGRDIIGGQTEVSRGNSTAAQEAGSAERQMPRSRL